MDQNTRNNLNAQLGAMSRQLSYQKGALEALMRGRDDVGEGRKQFFGLGGRAPFSSSDAGRQGQPIIMNISQDAPFVATHYPIVSWKPTLPAGTELFGMWRPVSSFPLPTQFAGAGVDGNLDLVAISYEIQETGSGRQLQNEAVLPLLSRMDHLVPLPCQTVFSENSVVTFTPTFERILFNSPTPPTNGQIAVLFPGYRLYPI